MSNKVYFGGIPTEIDVRKLIQAFGNPEVGAQITHEEIESTLNLERKDSRYRTVISAWVRQLKLQDIHLGAVPGVGLKALNEEERAARGVSGIQQGGRKQLRSIKDICSIRTTDPTLIHKQTAATRYGIALAAEQNQMMKQIKPPKQSQQMPRLPGGSQS